MMTYLKWTKKSPKNKNLANWGNFLSPKWQLIAQSGHAAWPYLNWESPGKSGSDKYGNLGLPDVWKFLLELILTLNWIYTISI